MLFRSQEEEEKLKQEQEQQQNNEDTSKEQETQKGQGNSILKPNNGAIQKPQENKPQTTLVP